MQKNFQTNPADAAIQAETLEKINRYTQKPLAAEDVFVFSVVLCDNEVDRDFERFSVQTLSALAPLFEGKTAIQNHSMNSADQSARTFMTEVIADPTRTTSLGEPYTYLKAYCYMPRIAKNEALIAEIGAGIKKEVSVGCAVQSSICSICGADERVAPCEHRRGKAYAGKTCHFVLENPSDAYEWSFVAVPAQKNAGVTKGFSEVRPLYKRLHESTDQEISLCADEAHRLAAWMDDLYNGAQDGAEYHTMLREKAVRLFAQLLPALDNTLTDTMCLPLSVKDLKQLGEMLEKAAALRTPATPQLAPQPPAVPDTPCAPSENAHFKF